MKRVFVAVFSVFIVTIGLTQQASAQDSVFVQIEAQPSLNAAEDRARDYTVYLADVNGFYLGSGWYGIALGPYTPADAEFVLRELRRNGRIPEDSYIVEPRRLRQQFWPIGANVLANLTPAAPQSPTEQTPVAIPAPTEAPTETPTETIVVEPTPTIEPDETPSQARASERLLSRDEKKELQVAMKWAGTYAGAIDGAYGKGTRRAMSVWQAQNGYEATGILTTAQRAALLTAYNEILEGMDLQLVRDDAAGIQMQLPLGVVDFGKFEPPFVQYNATGDVDAQVLLISQSGDRDTLHGLYDIIQTLEIMPLEGPREKNKTFFTLSGSNDTIHTEVFADLRNGEVKGFALVWPAGDEARRSRVFGEMKTSYQRISGVLDPSLASFGDDQAIDLISGLALRKPRLSRSGFFVDTQGAVLTSAEAVGTCSRITLDNDTEAQIASVDTALGLALVTPTTAMAPIDVARFQTAVPRIQSDIAVAGFPYEGVLGAPSLTFGKLADIRGLRGEDELNRLAIYAQSGDVGGPVLDSGGAVLGKLLPKRVVNGQTLPDEVSFSIDSDVIAEFLTTSGVTPQTVDQIGYVAPEDMTRLAANFTVLVSCWE